MTQEQICMAIAIVVYLLVVLGVGIVCSRKNRTVDDFYLGGRRLGPIVTAMSAEASDMNSWLLMGLPGVAYLTGLALGTCLNWLIVAKHLRNYSVKTNSITIPDFFSKRFRDKQKILMAIAAVIIVVFFVPYTASGFSACGKLFGTIFNLDYHTAMIAGAVVIIGYTCVGGFLAASTTDLIQSIIMTIALIIVFGFGMVFVWKYIIAPLGGIWNIYELLPAFLTASIAVVVVNLLTPAPEKEIVDEFEEVKTMGHQKNPVEEKA